MWTYFHNVHGIYHSLCPKINNDRSIRDEFHHCCTTLLHTYHACLAHVHIQWRHNLWVCWCLHYGQYESAIKTNDWNETLSTSIQIIKSSLSICVDPTRNRLLWLILGLAEPRTLARYCTHSFNGSIEFHLSSKFGLRGVIVLNGAKETRYGKIIFLLSSREHLN